MSDTSTGAGGGISVAGALGVLFVALKLLDKIDWPWVWVLAPFWIPLALFLLIVLGALVTAVVKK